MEPVIHHIVPGDFVVTQWSGGATRQIAIGPQGAVYADRDFLWRISSATVELPESDFTPLPDYQRLISVLEGEMRISHGNGPCMDLQPFQIHEFDGGVDTHSWGTCTDYNLMLRKGRCTGSLSSLHLHGGESAALPRAVQGEGTCELVLYCAVGDGVITEGETKMAFGSGEGVYIRAPNSPVLHSSRDASIMVAEIHCT